MLKLITRTIAAVAVGAVLLIGPSAGGAQAGTPCVFDGDLDAYLECILGTGATGGEDTVTDAETVESAQTLPRTGTEVGSLVGIGAALVIVGGAAVYGVRQRKADGTS